MLQDFLVLAFVVNLWGCGGSKEQNQGVTGARLPAEVAASASDDGEATSFIVSFRSSELTQDQFKDAVGESLYFSSALRERYLSDSRLRKLAYISTVAMDTSPDQLRFGVQRPFGGTALRHGLLAQVDFATNTAASEVLQQWEKSGDIWFFEPNGHSTLSVSQAALKSYQEDNFWWLDRINLVGALEGVQARLALNAPGSDHPPVIAVFDSGIDFEHPALRKNVWNKESAGSFFCPDDRHGCNTSRDAKGILGSGADVHPYGTNGPGKECSIDEGSCLHGTHVAGIIAGDMELGVPGICPFCQVMAIKVVEDFNGSGKVADGAILRGLKYVSLFQRAGKNVVRIVNSSFGKFQKTRSVALMVSQLRETRDGILVVGAAGNEDTQRRVYPAAMDNVIAVAAIDPFGRKAAYSNYGQWVDIAAPGGEGDSFSAAILSAKPGGGVTYSQGTSMATPMVSAVAGLVLAAQPDLSIQGLFDAIVSSANANLYDQDFAGGYNRKYYFPQIGADHVPLLGSGLLDAEAAISGKRHNLAASARNDRISPGCGTLVAVGLAPELGWFWLMFLPLLTLLRQVMMRLRNHEGGEKTNPTKAQTVTPD